MKNSFPSQKETRKAPISDLERFLSAMRQGKMQKMKEVLPLLEKSPPPGLWMHTALRQALEIATPHKMEVVKLLLQSKCPPIDTPQSDFISLCFALRVPKEIRLTLLEAGFTPNEKGCRNLINKTRYDGLERKQEDLEGVQAGHLRHANPKDVIEACAKQMARDIDSPLFHILRAALPNPVPHKQLTRAFIYQLTVKRDPVMTSEAFDKIQGTGLIDLQEIQREISNLYEKSDSFYNFRPIQENLDAITRWFNGDNLNNDTASAALPPRPKSRL